MSERICTMCGCSGGPMMHELREHILTSGCVDALKLALADAQATIEQADTTRREWEVRAATSYAAGRAAGLREAAEACMEARGEYSCTFRGELAKAGVNECHSRIVALAPPAANPHIGSSLDVEHMAATGEVREAAESRRVEVAGLAELAKQATRHARPCVPGVNLDDEDCGCSVRQSRVAIDALARLAMVPSLREATDV